MSIFFLASIAGPLIVGSIQYVEMINSTMISQVAQESGRIFFLEGQFISQ